MMNTKLSDFTEEQLSLIGKTLIYKKFASQDAIANWKKYPTLEPMFRTDIEAQEKEIAELETLITQFVGAAVEKQMESKALLN